LELDEVKKQTDLIDVVFIYVFYMSLNFLFAATNQLQMGLCSLQKFRESALGMPFC